MPEQNNIVASQLQTNSEAEEQIQAQQSPAAGTEETASSTMFKQKLPEGPVYNPLLGMTPTKFAATFAGSDQEHPLYTTDAYGGMQFHPENLVHQKGPARLQVDSATGAWDVEGRKAALNNRIDEIAKETTAYYQTLAPESARTEDYNARVKQWLGAGYDFTGRSAVSFSSFFLNGFHGVLAQDRNLAEFSWNVYKEEHKNEASFQEVALYLKQVENDNTINEALGRTGSDPYSFQRQAAFSKAMQDKYGLSEEARAHLARYSQLLQDRDEDERRMQIGSAYDSEMSNIEQLARSKDGAFALNLNENDEEESVALMLGKFSGDVAGSLGAAYLTGVAGGKVLGAVGKIGSRLFGRDQAVLLGMRGGATAALSAGAQLSETAMVTPVFLNQYNQIRTESLLAGKDIDEANAIGFLAGAAEAGLEFAGFRIFKRFYKADGIFTNYVLRNIFPEALQEGSQTAAENLITQHFGVTQKQWSDIMAEIGLSMVAGAIGGGVFTGAKFRVEGALAFLENTADKFGTALSDIAVGDIDVGVNLAMASTSIDDAIAPEEQKRESRQRAKQEYEKLTANQKKAHDEFVKAYKDLKDFYTKKAKKLNPKITQEQLAAGWTGIKVLTQLQREGNILVDNYYKAVNMMTSYLNKSDKMTKYNMRGIKDTLYKHGMQKEQVERLTSQDAIERNEAAWDIAENHISDSLQAQGVNETEAQMSARFVRSLLKDTTLINPGTTPLQVVKGMKTNVLNLQNAIFFGQDIPEAFAPISSDIQQTKTTPKATRDFAMRVADAVLNRKPSDKEVKQINSVLYSDMNHDNGLRRLKSLARQQAAMTKQVVENMPTKLTRDISEQEYIAMWLMNKMGMKWSQIFNQFGIPMQEGYDADQSFADTAEEEFVKPSSDAMKKLQRISDGVTMTPEQYVGQRGPRARQQNQYNQTEKENIRTAAGFYEKNENLIVLRENKPGTAFHEYGHFAITTLITDQMKLRSLGLLPDTSPLNAIYDRLSSQMKRDGRILTERQFQETVLDATMRLIEKGQTNDPKLTALFNMLKADGYVANKRLSASLMHNEEGQGLSREQKAGLNQELSNILNGMTPSAIMQKAMALRDMALFKSGYDQSVSATANAKSMMKQLADGAREFIRTTPLRDNAKLMNDLKKAEKSGNLLAVAMVAESASSQAMDFAVDVITDGENLRMMQEYSEQAGQTAGERAWKDGGMFFDAQAATVPQEDYRPDPEIIEDIKAKLPNALHNVVDIVYHACEKYLQSAEGAAANISNELRAILMKEIYDQSMSIQYFRNAIADCANAFDEHKKKWTPEVRENEVKLWREFHADLGSGAEGARERASSFIKQKLGEKAQKSWDEAMNLLDGNKELYEKYLDNPKANPMGYLYKGVKNMLIEAGVSADLLNTNYIFFPMHVNNYEGLTQDTFGHSVTYNAIDKERAKLAKQYAKKHGKYNEKTKQYELTDEQKAQMDLLITDAINSNFQRNATDENRVTAFFRRTTHDYTKNPDMLKYYDDVFTTLDKYMDAAYRTVMMRNLIGKTTIDKDSKTAFEEIINEKDGRIARGKIGRYLNSLPLGQVSTDAMANLMEKLRQLAQRSTSDPKDLFNVVRQINQFTTLGSPINALNQIQDLEFSLLLFGFKPTMDAISKVLKKDSDAVRLREAGLETSNEVYRVVDNNVLGRITKWVYSKTGFEWADRFGKEVTINAATIWAQNVVTKAQNVKSGKEANDFAELNYILDEIWPAPDTNGAMSEAAGATPDEIATAQQEYQDKRDQVLQDLKEGNVTPDTKLFQWYLLTKLQPQNAACVPGMYNTANGFGKSVYQFSTVALRQLGFLKDYFEMKNKTQGSKAAWEAAARFIGFALMVGIPKETIEALLKGQKPNITNAGLNSIGHVMMVNSYTLSVMKNEGFFKGITTQTQPSFAALDNISRDAFRVVAFKPYKGYTLKSVPIIGMFMWHWMLGGRSQHIKESTALFHSSPTKPADRETLRDAQDSLREMEK